MRFWLANLDYLIEEVADQWYGPDGAYLKVRTDAGSVDVVRYDVTSDNGRWQACRRAN